MPWTQVMFSRDRLTGYGERDGAAVVTFADGFELQFIPQWQKDTVKRVSQVLLLRNQNVVAEVSLGCFSTDGTVGQRDLGHYCNFAIELEREVYRHYRAGKISENEWQKRFRAYWKIVIKSRQIARALTLEQLPIRKHPS